MAEANSVSETAEALKKRLRDDIDHFAKYRNLDSHPPTASDNMGTLGLQAGTLDNPVTYWQNERYCKPHDKK